MGGSSELQNMLHPTHPMHPDFFPKSLTIHKKKKKLHFLHFLHLKKILQTCLKFRLPKHFGAIAVLYYTIVPLWKNAQPLSDHGSADFD